MKPCSYCGRENEDGQETCSGCGTDLRPPKVEAEFNGILDPITPPRRCHCGGVMQYYTPAPGSSTFLRPYRYRYVCGKCGNRAIVVPYDKRRILIPLAVVGFVVGLCLYFSNPLENIERNAFKTRWVIIALLVVVAGLVAGKLALITAWNRRRYPITDEPPSPPDPLPPSPSKTSRNP